MNAVEDEAAAGPGRGRHGRNQRLVLDALRQTDKPVGAYDLLRQLRGEGFCSPVQVYRALDQLIAEGIVHKIESVSAYALCTHTDCRRRGHAVFAVCARCGQATEAHDSSLARLLAEIALKQGFRIEGATVELSGLCETCSDA